MLYLPQDYHEASPKAISRRTSYLRVRLEFLRYPSSPPFQRMWVRFSTTFTAASTWTWIGHPVSGLHLRTGALLRLGSLRLAHLNCLARTRNSPDRSTKVRGCTYKVLPTACKHKGFRFSFTPSGGPFHLSFTVLCAIGH